MADFIRDPEGVSTVAKSFSGARKLRRAKTPANQRDGLPILRKRFLESSAFLDGFAVKL